MPKIIKDGQVVDDSWQLFELSEDSELANAAVPTGQWIVPLQLWLAQRDKLKARSDIGIQIGIDDDIELLADDYDSVPLLAFDFPVFMDGRGFSAAFLIRDRFAFKGELRASGAFIRDQLCYLQRCGFNAFALSAEDLEAAKDSLSDLQEAYQASADKAPLFRRRG
ncbi:DUF934 domain-containing protein [uncultured Pseudoteredinibacter sp.]|uniref:DUF934 domain-containing protein n=1 Tax=uncultured Pseudoteredinibacter sp. TaxID=1641701 RepID=UPI00261B77C7|nr:DUF934 domain-containing protein [uncultured Pseudoteredinibacter sp.]